jgi:hypothetical protein
MQKLSILVFFAVALAACGYPAPSTVQVLVDTFPAGASCAVFYSGNLIGSIEPTPGITRVPNEEQDYLVSCQRGGFEEVSAVVHARAQTRTLWQNFGSTQISAAGGASVAFALIPRQRFR